MQEPIIPENETQRLACLHSLCILDTEPEQRFDRITRLAASLFNVPIALVSLVDAERQWFKSKVGLSAAETGRNISFCGHAILQREVLYVPNALKDPRFSDNPLVSGPPYIRFYAGAPLSLDDTHRIGTLCLIDVRPRRFSPEQLQRLQDLAGWVERELHMLRLAELSHMNAHQEAYLTSILQAVVEGIVTVNAEGVIEAANQAMKEMLRVSSEQLNGAHFSQWLKNDAQLLELLQRGQEGDADTRDGIHRLEVELVRSSGESFPAQLSFRQVDMGGATRWVGSVADISDRKRAEAMKKEFVAVVSHELRTPLTSIKGALGLLSATVGAGLNEPAAKLLSIASNNSERLLVLVNDILDIEKLEAGHVDMALEETELLVELEQAMNMNGPYAKARNVTMQLEHGAGDVIVGVDKRRFQQVMSNLISNAVKFSPAQGRVTIRSRLSGGGEVFIDVVDEGVGISEIDQARIFDKFFQAPPTGRQAVAGTGLGLSIVRALIEQMGGGVSVKSQLHKGSCFTLRLPARCREIRA
ncbi:ATP-binding protein [Hahella aquimaris]|uniref:GAF domain-containing sensor histidine kinase n=1 Tax=Hahella sp. HNIBRBA332 TaxID=3015983 RepID=UPI00273B6970|nr:ATP-binding protein [Hahella sp. HNIBRBA332]WLQ17207.1 ATP-binding protein [Hahella sp. HNIBRBA332]